MGPKSSDSEIFAFAPKKYEKESLVIPNKKSLAVSKTKILIKRMRASGESLSYDLSQTFFFGEEYLKNAFDEKIIL